MQHFFEQQSPIQLFVRVDVSATKGWISTLVLVEIRLLHCFVVTRSFHGPPAKKAARKMLEERAAQRLAHNAIRLRP